MDVPPFPPPGHGPLPCFVLCSADGPDAPFTGQMWAWDTLRLLVVLAGVVVVVLAPKCVAVSRTWGQRARFVAFGAFCLSVIATEYEHIGDFASARLAFNTLAVAAALYGTHAFLRREVPCLPKTAPTVGAHRR